MLWALAIIGQKVPGPPPRAVAFSNGTSSPWAKACASCPRTCPATRAPLQTLPEPERELAPALRAPGRAPSLRGHGQHRRRLGLRPQRLRGRGRPAGLGAVPPPLRRLGHPRHRLHRHRARHRRRAGPGAPRHARRPLGSHRRPSAPPSTRTLIALLEAWPSCSFSTTCRASRSAWFATPSPTSTSASS